MLVLKTYLPIIFTLSLLACTDPSPSLDQPSVDVAEDTGIGNNVGNAGDNPKVAPEQLLERIVFSSLRPSNWDIFYFDSPGASGKRLTEHPGLDYDAEFSPDGHWVVFTSERRGQPDLYVIDLQNPDATPALLIDSPAMEDQATISPDGSTIAFVSTHNGNAEIYTLPFEPGATRNMEGAVNLTNHRLGDFRPSFSPDGDKIAFSTDRDRPAFGHPYLSFTRQRVGEIYVMDIDGQNLTRLTDNPSWDGSPEWSTDGETLYFYSARPRELPGPPTSPILGQEGGFRIWTMAADGSNLQPITGEGMEALAPALTSDGRLAFQTRTGYAQWTIKSISLDDSQLRQESDEASDYWIPDFHHESGAMVAHGVGPVSEKSQAVEAILGDGALLSADHPSTAELPDRTLMIYPMRHTTGLAPHPMSDEVVVTIENEAGSRLALSDYQGISEETIFTAPGIGIVSGTRDRLFDMKYSDDGEWITYSQGYFAGESDKQADVWIMRRDGSERTNLTKSDANDGVAGFSPDGTKLVFRSARAGSFDLYTMNTDGSEVQRITDHPRRDNFPVFSPMGDAIVFSSDRDSELDDLGFRTFDNYILELNDDGSPGVLRRLTNDRGQDSHPWYSPDANWVVFTSERDGISDEEPLVQEVVFAPQMYGEIYAQRLSDGLTIRLTHNKWEEGNPFWLIPLTASAD